jgi:hypothetical protein
LKAIYKYILVVAVLFGLLLANELSKPKPVNWRKTYAKNDKIPFGGYIVYDQLEKLNGNYPIKTIKKSPYEYLDNPEDIIEESPANLIIIQSEGFIDLYEWDKIKDFAKKGNSVFIASNRISNDISEDLDIEINWLQDVLTDDTVFRGRLLDDAFKKKANYISNFVTDISYFEFTDSNDKINTLGVLNGFYPDFIEYKMGKGTIYLHANPSVFSNIHILNKNNYNYTFAALSYLPQQAIIWDEFYKNLPRKSQRASTPLAFILSEPALKWALYTLLLGALLFFIFRAKRRQRIIPIVTPLANTSLEFTETIGRLYFNKGNHYDIALKRIQYFTQNIYSKYNLRFDEKNPDFVQHLAEKSSVAEKDIIDIIKRISSIKKRKGVGPNELLELNKRIDSFYKTAK